EMFNGCENLSTAPELPATTLDTMCYMRMFENCTSLVQAPELPATSLKELSYFNMFKGCTSLNYIKVGIMTLDNEYSATIDWVEGVDGPGVFIFPCGSTYDKHGSSQVPTNFEIGGYAYTIDSTIIAEGSFTWKDITYTESALWDDSLQTVYGCDSIVRYSLIINGTAPTPVTIMNVPACDSFEFNGITYRENSIWNDTLQTSSGGDSIIIYRLTIHKSSVIDSTIVAEGSFTKEGITYTENTSWNDTLRTAFGCDSIIRYNLEIQSVITEPITRDTSVSACDSYTFKGITYRENSEWNDTMQTASGGDSIVIYHLTLHKGVTVDSTIIAEESFTWKEITYTESTTWNDTLQTIFGCDSIIQYRLVINGIAPTPVVNENISACDSFLFKGITYRENSEWNDTLQTANGGDSIVIYHLTLHKSATVDSSIVAEGSFTWKGTVFTENTSWNDTLQTIHGCDSIVTYHLEIQSIDTNPITVDENLSACDSFLFKGITYREDSEWNDTLQTTSGSDSIITYHLTIHKGVTVDSTIIAEGSFTWKGTTYTEDASWNDTLQTVNGCDSIVRYSLIVNEEKGPLQLTVEDKLYLVLPGGSETISYELTGGEGSKYEVRYNGQALCSGDVTNDSTVALTCPASLEPGTYTATLTMFDDEGEKAEEEFTFNVMLPDNKQKSYYVKVWNDVVICRNGDG
ncbi:MAG: hypothetical protein IKZ67_08000, partial [Paludibacteraceae bacterium]|nr:hypothetical protein [Paludibacteraceae bacterium]